MNCWAPIITQATSFCINCSFWTILKGNTTYRACRVAVILFHKTRRGPCQTCHYVNTFPKNQDCPGFPRQMASLTSASQWYNCNQDEDHHGKVKLDDMPAKAGNWWWLCKLCTFNFSCYSPPQFQTVCGKCSRSLTAPIPGFRGKEKQSSVSVWWWHPGWLPVDGCQ